MIKKTTFFAISIILFAACKTNLVHIKVKDPAPVTLSGTIKRVGVLNRSRPSDENKTANKIHGVLSGETERILKEGSAEGIRGLKDALMSNQRFEKIVVLDSVDMRSAGFGMFPSPLSWEVVEALCAKYKLDALFSLELFDTDLKVNSNILPAITDPNPINILNPAQYQVTMVTTVKTGWRIYDPAQRMIIDEMPITKQLTFTANGINVVAATAALLERTEAIKKTANEAGYLYADRILPYWTTVTREYYVKGNYNFVVAKRKSQTGNWDGAGELWNNETKNTNRKIAGRACYNMAIVNEINGDLDAAINWAQKAYEDHGNKFSLRYINLLKNRKIQNNRLDVQMEEIRK